MADNYDLWDILWRSVPLLCVETSCVDWIQFRLEVERRNTLRVENEIKDAVFGLTTWKVTWFAEPREEISIISWSTELQGVRSGEQPVSNENKK